jgi:hypothetical protein
MFHKKEPVVHKKEMEGWDTDGTCPVLCIPTAKRMPEKSGERRVLGQVTP